MERIVLHLDIDYFFAQVEENEHPEYKGKPVVVCVYSGRDETSGVVSTSNYEARKYGVKSGMPIKIAIAHLKGTGAVFLPVDHELYSRISQGVMEIVSTYGEKFEYASIDEGVIEISEAAHRSYGEAKEIAEKIKKEILGKFHLTCSIGIGPNRLVAKIASDFRKPNGLTVVKPDEVGAFLEKMDVDKIPGIGKKSRDFLATMGIHVVGQLRDADPALLGEAFGKKTAGWLINSAKGIDETEVGIAWEQKQVSRIMTLKNDTRDLDGIMNSMKPLVQEIADEIREMEISFSSVGATLIDENMKTFTKSRTLAHPTGDANEITKIAKMLFAEIISETKMNFRRAGIKIEKLEKRKGQKTLGEF